MPTIDWNLETWDKDYSWPKDGDEWSSPWGTAAAQWFGSILPRIFPFLAGDILEIACGHGRWTNFLLKHSSSYIGVDLAPSCVEFCRNEFLTRRFEVTDGYTLPMVAAASIDFAFSFDSLVHAEADVLASYVQELARVLKPKGIAFLHYSENDDPGKREPIITAPDMRELVTRAGMSVVHQEIIPWGNQSRVDGLITIINSPNRPSKVTDNPRFMEDAAIIKHVSGALRNV